MDLNKQLNLAIEAAKKAGKIIRDSRPQSVESKGIADYVTEVDLLCEKTIIEHIRVHSPKDNFLGEEGSGDTPFSEWSKWDNLWIIDPIDGTTNFVRGLAHSCVSIGFYHEGRVKVGVIYDPYRDELFSAIKGCGAFLNGKPIKISTNTHIDRALFATGFPFRYKDKIDSYNRCFSEVLRASSGVRRMGSAALDLAWCAAGRFDGFFEGWLSPWDLAAGILIVEEAGGVVRDFNGEGRSLQNGSIVVSNGKLDLFGIVNKFLGR